MSANLKQKSVHALLLAFILASILFLLPDAAVDHEFGFTSSELEVKETVEKNVTSENDVLIDASVNKIERLANERNRILQVKN